MLNQLYSLRTPTYQDRRTRKPARHPGPSTAYYRPPVLIVPGTNGMAQRKLPSLQFYPGDWFKDATLQELPLAARGAWFEICLRAFEQPTRGIFRTVNRTLKSRSTVQKSILGCRSKHIDLLIQCGLLKVAPRSGSLYVKRILLDELERRRANRRLKKHRNETALKRERNGVETPKKRPSSSSSSTSTSTSVSKNKEGEEERAAPAIFFELPPRLNTEEMQKTWRDWHSSRS